MRINRTTVVVAFVAILALAGTGTAAAFWTMHGTGTGTVEVAKIVPLTITQQPVKNLIPGVVRELEGTITNDNDFAVTVIQKIEMTVKVDKRDVPLSIFTFKAPTIHTVLIKAHGQGRFSGGSVLLRDDPKHNDDVAQGATLTISYSL